MKKILIGHVPLFGGGFYPSRILDQLLRLGGINPVEFRELCCDADSIGRMTVQDFKDGFFLSLVNGRSFYVVLERCRVAFYKIVKSSPRWEAPVRPAVAAPSSSMTSLPAWSPPRPPAAIAGPAVDLAFRPVPEASASPPAPLVMVVPGAPSEGFFPELMKVVG